MIQLSVWQRETGQVDEEVGGGAGQHNWGAWCSGQWEAAVDGVTTEFTVRERVHTRHNTTASTWEATATDWQTTGWWSMVIISAGFKLNVGHYAISIFIVICPHMI